MIAILSAIALVAVVVAFAFVMCTVAVIVLLAALDLRREKRRLAARERDVIHVRGLGEQWVGDLEKRRGQG